MLRVENLAGGSTPSLPINSHSVLLCNALTGDGTIGVAWLPEPGMSPGGICEHHQRFAESEALPAGSYSLNTVMLTYVNSGKRLSDGVMSLTLTHELGHAFGAHHDEDMLDRPDCLPSDDSPHGKFVMSATVSQEEPKDHNWMFSLCSRQSIEPVVTFKGDCLEARLSHCGNSLVEHKEECDCGTSYTCDMHDKCCTPRSMQPFTGTAQPEQGCRLKSDSKCSPRVHRCCTEDCGLAEKGVTCRKMTDCTSASECDGRSPICPAPTVADNGTPCAGGLGQCKDGVCSKSPCEQAGLVDCLCKVPRYHACSVCCRCADGPKAACVPAQWLHIAVPSYSLLLPPGSRCLPNGICDNDSRCIIAQSEDGPPVTSEPPDEDYPVYNDTDTTDNSTDSPDQRLSQI